MRYFSICSGIEAASVAWHPLGWRPWAFAEIEAFPSAILKHHYPEISNLGDITKFREWPDAAIDVLIGGTPCQSFSVAGLRKGLADPRGNLALTYLAIADKYRPEWLVWENVPGVLSSEGGRDFGAFLGGLGQLGYGFAYRVLDAQHVRVDGFGRAVPQRRRRVFVVGHLGDWRRAAAVLFERASLSGDSPPRREAGERIADSLTVGANQCSGRLGDFVEAFGGNDTSGPIDVATARNAHGGPHGRLDFESETFVAHTLRADGFDASEDGTGRGTPIVPVMAFDPGQSANPKATHQFSIEHSLPLIKGRPPAIAFDARQSDVIQYGNRAGPLDTDAFSQAVAFDVAGCLAADMGQGNQFAQSGQFVAQGWAVRRLTPVECERLQGFPDNYTAIPYRGKAAADGPRYKALGNSMAYNVMRWIGRRIAMVAAL
jgi:DNA (cytosine-5)-methyltransferase 1